MRSIPFHLRSSAPRRRVTLSLVVQSARTGAGAVRSDQGGLARQAFVESDYKLGYGLWVDCIDPIMQGKEQPAKADKPLPSLLRHWLRRASRNTRTTERAKNKLRLLPPRGNLVK